MASHRNDPVLPVHDGVDLGSPCQASCRVIQILRETASDGTVGGDGGAVKAEETSVYLPCQGGVHSQGDCCPSAAGRAGTGTAVGLGR